MIYHAIYEIRYRLWKRPDEKRILSFVKKYLDGREIAESSFLGKIENQGGNC